jgi:hypothetical protein
MWQVVALEKIWRNPCPIHVVGWMTATLLSAVDLLGGVIFVISPPHNPGDLSPLLFSSLFWVIIPLCSGGDIQELASSCARRLASSSPYLLG